jgi:PAS domain S-box
MIDTNNDTVDLQSNVKFQIFDNFQDGVIVYEIIRGALNEVVNLRIKYLNKASVINEFSSYEDVIGKTITESYDDDTLVLHLKMANNVVKSGRNQNFKTYFKPLDKCYLVSAYLSDPNTLVTISADITEKEKMEEKLQKQADLLDLTRDAIILRDMGDRIIFWNHGAEERYGWMKEEAYGKVFHKLLKTDFSEPLTGIFGQLFQKGHWEGEVTHTMRDGKKIVVLSRWELRKNENSEPTGYMEINTDITKRKKVDMALKESENKLRAIIEHSPDAIIVTDLNGNVIECNTGGMNLFGFKSKEEIDEINTFDLIDPEDKLRAFHDITGTLSKGYLDNTNYKLLTRRGHMFPAELSVGVIYNNSEPIFYVCLIRDITERKKMEKALKEFGESQSKIAGELEQARNNLEEQVKERTAELEKAYNALKESEEKFRVIFTSANDMISLSRITEDDKPGRFIEINEVGIKRLGYSKEELLNMSPLDILVPDNIDKIMPPEVKNFNENYQLEMVELTKDGKRIPADVSLQFINYGGIKACLSISRDITERKKIENTLQFQADILKNVRDAVIVYDLQGKVIYWNEGAESIYGYLREEIMGKNVKTLYWNRNEEVFASDLEKIIEMEEYAGEWEGKRKDGSKVFVDIRETVMFDKNRNIIGIIGVSKDITERKESEKALNDSEKQLRMITDNMVDMVSQTDIHGIIQYVSPSGKILLGYEPEELIGTSIFDYVHHDNIGEVKNAFRTAFIETTSGRMEIQFKHADGSYIWLEIAGNIFFDEKKLVMGAVFGSRDISERKMAEKQIKKQYSVLNGINRIFRESLTSETEEEVADVALSTAEELTSSKLGFIAEINNEDLVSIIVSSSVGKLYRLPPFKISKSIESMKINDYLRSVITEGKTQIVNDLEWDTDKKLLPKGHPSLNSFLCLPLKQGDKIIGLIALGNKDGGYTLEDAEIIESLSVAIVESLMSFKSKNKLKKYKNRLEETVGDLKRSNEELQRFAYVASHDLQEPLRTIASFTQLLERRYKGKFDADADEFMDYTVEAALRMKEQIKGLLEYSRISTKGNEFKDVNSEFILNQAIDNLQFAIKETNAEVTYDSLHEVMCDAGQLQRVFQNLISNAIKFKKENSPPKIHVSSKKDLENKEYIFSVTDNGIGIEEQYMERIFVIFQRLHTMDEYHGTGIGLSIVKRIIERHGGRIWVESEFGRGSVFNFTLPYSKTVL